MKKLLVVLVSVLAFAGVASAADGNIANGDWADPAAWNEGVLPDFTDPNATLWVGPGGTTGTNYVTVTTSVPQVQNEVIFSDVNVDITGSMDIEDADDYIWAGAYGPTVINVSGDGFFRAGPDTIALDGRTYKCHINLSDRGFLESYWPHFYEGDTQVTLSDDAIWRTWGMWFPENSTVYPTAGGAYNIDISGNAKLMVGNTYWSESDATAAISSGFITGTGLTVSTSADTFYTVIAAPGKTATYPNPSTGAEYVAVNSILYWSPGSNVVAPVTYNVYFDTNSSPSTLVSAGQSDAFFDPNGTSDMAYDTTYYWRIDTIDTAGTHTGEVWSFTTPPTPETLAWYKFNGNANDQIDILNNGVNGIISSVYSTGIDSQAITFNADDPDQHIEVSSTIADGLRQASISFWINPQGDSTPPGVIMGTDDLPVGSALLMSGGVLGADGKIGIQFSVIGNSPQQVDVPADPNAWNHVAVSYDAVNKKCRMYLNGVLDEEYDYTTAGDLIIGPMNIGAWYSGGGGYQDALLGSVDDLRIFNHLLSDLHVASLYTNFEPSVDLCIDSLAPALDLSGDCVVNTEDFAIFALSWLDCTIVPDCSFELP